MLGVAGLILLGLGLRLKAPLPNPEQILFWILAVVAVASSAAAIVARNPIYTAMLFACSLLGVAGLFVLQHAQFLGVATIVVYAGAIVVTFLFVLMLAQPEGQSSYDRLSWASFAPLAAIVAATSFVALLMVALAIDGLTGGLESVPVSQENHLARLGAELFSRHLVAVELTGTLLLVALVGAIAIVIHGRSPSVENRPVRRQTLENRMERG
jgi:NADH-quinone oxidoreductase subunit J